MSELIMTMYASIPGIRNSISNLFGKQCISMRLKTGVEKCLNTFEDNPQVDHGPCQ